MTKKEQADLAYKRKVYELALERQKQIDKLSANDEYRLPEAYDDPNKAGGQVGGWTSSPHPSSQRKLPSRPTRVLTL